MCHTPTVETTVFQLHLLEILDFAARQTIADIQIFKYFTKVVLPTIISRFLQLNLYATLKDCPNLSLSHAVQIKENMKDAAGYKKSCRAKDRPWSFVVTTGTLCNGYTRHDWTRRQGGTRPRWPRRVSSFLTAHQHKKAILVPFMAYTIDQWWPRNRLARGSRGFMLARDGQHDNGTE